MHAHIGTHKMKPATTIPAPNKAFSSRQSRVSQDIRLFLEKKARNTYPPRTENISK
jgi:hypothetical protein